MADDSKSTPLDEVIADYLRAEGAGGQPDRAALIRRYPQHAGELRDFFNDHDRFQSLVGQKTPGVAGVTARIDLMKKPLPPPNTIRKVTPDTRERNTHNKRFGDYELGEEIARGAMGIVYRARQISLDRPVALKMMLETSFAQPDDIRRFRQEARAAGRLEHPNIVPIYDVGECNGRQYYTMRLIPCGNLSNIMKDLRTDQRRVARIMAAVARAVNHAHQHGILHRDLKPANILMDSEGLPHVADFGLAKRMDAPNTLTMSGQIMGTAAYMSPEQASGETKRVTVTSDIYSLGAIFYEMLTGKQTFSGDNCMEIILKVREKDPPPPLLLNPEIDHDLNTICMKCLEKKPEQRYATAKDLADDIEAWLEKRAIVARPPSLASRLSRLAGRHPAFVAAGSTAILLSSVALLTGLWKQSGNTSQYPAAPQLMGISLQDSRTVDLAYALMDKKEHTLARQLFEKVIKDSRDPLEIMDAEKGLRKLAELDEKTHQLADGK